MTKVKTKASSVDKNISEPRLSVRLVDNGLVRLRHWAHLNPRLDLVISRELQHLSNFIRTARTRARHAATLPEQPARVEGPRILGGTNLHESALHAEKAEVFLQGQLERILSV